MACPPPFKINERKSNTRLQAQLALSSIIIPEPPVRTLGLHILFLPEQASATQV